MHAAFGSAILQGSTPKTHHTEQHPALNTLMIELPTYLAHHRPRSWFIEEVEGIRRVSSSGETYLTIFLRRVCALGYSARVVSMDHSLFVNMPRSRVWLVGISKEAGGTKAATWVSEHMTEICAELSKGAQASFLDVVPKGDLVELDFLDKNKVMGGMFFN